MCAVGVARRSGAPSGTSRSIYDDLRCIRSRGGITRAEPNDLAGVLALPLFDAQQRDFAFDAARSLLAGFVRDQIGVAEADSSPGQGPALAAASLRLLLLATNHDTINYEHARNDIGAEYLRSADYVRVQEDKLLQRIARGFLARYGSTSGPSSGSTGARLNAHSILAEEATLSSATHPLFDEPIYWCLTILRNTLTDLVLQSERSTLQRATGLVLFRIGQYFAARETISWITNRWGIRLGAEEEGLWPLTLQGRGMTRQTQRAWIANAANESNDEPQVFLDLLNSHSEYRALPLVALDNFVQQTALYRKGIADDCDILRITDACDTLLILLQYAEDDRLLDNAQTLPSWFHSDIYYLIGRSTWKGHDN